MPALRSALQWIADNDDPTVLEPADVAASMTVHLVADMWSRPGKPLEELDLAKKIVRMRRKTLREERGK